MKFKVGQTVELINNEEISADLGATAVVIHIDNEYISVIWTRDKKWHNQGDGGYFPTDFKILPQKNQQLEFAFMGE